MHIYENLGSIDFKMLAKNYKTPLFLYDLDHIKERFLRIKDALNGVDSTICYALKANSNLSIIKFLASLGSGADCVSINEIKRAILGGIKKERIIFSGVGKSKEELHQALELGILFINIESFSEFLEIEKIAKSLNKIAHISVRVNPNIDAKTHPYISTGLSENKFGLDYENAQEIFSLAQRSKFVKIIGIHFHIGSQILAKEPLLEATQKMLDLTKDIKSMAKDLKYFDIGGGFGINYIKSEFEFDVQKYLEEIKYKIKDINLSLICEPGRFIVGNGGFLLTKVLREKASRTKRFIIVDAAMNDLMRPSLYNAVHEIIKLDSNNDTVHEDAQNICDVVGPICESGDYLAKNIQLPKCQEDDLLLIKSAGAYAYSMSSNYNSRMRCAEIAYTKRDGEMQYFVIKDREEFEKSVENEMKNMNNIESMLK